MTGILLGRGLDAGKDVSFDQDVGVLAHIERMASVTVPVVVVGVPVVAKLDLGGTTGGVVDVIVRKSDLVVLTITEPNTLHQRVLGIYLWGCGDTYTVQ